MPLCVHCIAFILVPCAIYIPFMACSIPDNVAIPSISLTRPICTIIGIKKERATKLAALYIYIRR